MLHSPDFELFCFPADELCGLLLMSGTARSTTQQHFDAKGIDLALALLQLDLG
jgi:hypothetical protein